VNSWFSYQLVLCTPFFQDLSAVLVPYSFYLNYGLVKEKMIATKSAHVLVVHMAKMVTYAAFGAMTMPYLGYGLVISITAAPANWLGQLAPEN